MASMLALVASVAFYACTCSLIASGFCVCIMASVIVCLPVVSMLALVV